MNDYRTLTASEIAALEANRVWAEDWSQVEVSAKFRTAQLRDCCLEGHIVLGEDARVERSRVKNYRIGARSIVRDVQALECREESAFGNGVEVAAVNECGGRNTMIHTEMTAQTAYMTALYRHRPAFIARMEAMTHELVAQKRDTMGTVGEDCRITGARFVREMELGNRVMVDGASILQNGTLMDDVHIGVDVKAYDFIVAEGAKMDNGVVVERSFVGEGSVMDKNFTASDSLFFANAHCENGEAASIFAGPYTVSHHKSSLLIAGYFSFFNAGSGSNQSNHLFKSGAVHQSIHLRGCKFASSAYVMSPAIEGAFTMVMGHHSFHHDTTIFPYSYLVERDGKSVLMPGANLQSYGSVRDIEKWPKRDLRTVNRDIINYEEYNPYIMEQMLHAIDALHELEDGDPDAPTYVYNKVQIRASSLRRGLGLYNKTLVAAIGKMLSEGQSLSRYDGTGRWIDLAGQYITKREVDRVIDAVEHQELTTFQAIDNRLRVFHIHYADYAHGWAEAVYASILGHAPSDGEIEDIRRAGDNAHLALRAMAEEDRKRDCSLEMAVGYGIDSENEEERAADFIAVRGLKA